jgi:delta1-piperideine-2-carboxylate reductase
VSATAAKRQVDEVTLSLDQVGELSANVLRHAGYSAANNHAITAAIVAAERDGAHAHGLFRLPGYVGVVKSGRADGHAEPELREAAPAVLAIDARRGFSQRALAVGRPRLVAKAYGQGIAALSIHNSYNFGALWYDIEPLAEAGLIAFAYVNSQSFVAPQGGTRRLFGTNPLAFACPRAHLPPLVMDMASAASARGELQLHARDGKLIPPGWGLDPEGRPSEDASAVLAGAQLPFGGHKGSAIALMIEVLAAGLTGGNFAFEATAQYQAGNNDGGPSNTGELVLPGDRRYAARIRTPHIGIRLPKPVHDELLRLLPP